MSAPRNDGGPAFPNLKANSCGPKTAGEAGMSLRDYAAIAALPAIIAATSAGQHYPVMEEGETHIRPAIARDAYAMADAMLAERAKP